jgi:PAS domain S-box-containing protein
MEKSGGEEMSNSESDLTEQRFRRYFELPLIGLAITSPDRRLIEVNQKLCDMFGYSVDELTGMSWVEITHPEDVAENVRLLEQALRGETEGYSMDKRFIHRKGGIVWGSLSARCVRRPDGTIDHLVLAVLDITQRKRAEQALRDAQADLAHVTRVAALGELTASIAHEINQPLGAIVNNASACLRWLAAQNLEEARQSAALVIADGHRASQIIGRIRALAKKAPPQKEWLDVNDTLREAITLAHSEVQRNRVALQTRLSEDVPPVRADRIQLQQVVFNLIVNAIEAMSGATEGPRELWVTSEKVESTAVRITVRDSGPGLDPKGLDHLFDAFYTTKPHGLGMGLAISRSIVEVHDGRLWATANDGRGATFQFTLPTGGERAS